MYVCACHQKAWQQYDRENGRKSKGKRVSKLKGLSVCLLDCDRLSSSVDLL